MKSIDWFRLGVWLAVLAGCLSLWVAAILLIWWAAA